MSAIVLSAPLFDKTAPANDTVTRVQDPAGIASGNWVKGNRVLYWATSASLDLELHEISIVAEDGRQLIALPIAPKGLLGLKGHVEYTNDIPKEYWKKAGINAQIHFRLRKKPARHIRTAGPSPMDLIDHYTTNDVVFLFPRGSLPPRLLWGNSTELATTSSYFKDLFFSGFSESTLHPAPMLASTLLDLDKDTSPEIEGGDADVDHVGDDLSNISTLAISKSGTETQPNQALAEEVDPVVQMSNEWIDSDDEPDSAQLGMESRSHPIRRIMIKDTPYKTYRALLFYLATGEVTFSPIKSSAAATQTANMEDDGAPPIAFDVSKPLPVSPKSLYALSHSLSIPTLQSLCLENISSQLSSVNVVEELFSSFAVCYDEVKEAAMKVALANWKEVVKGPGMLKFQRALKDNEVGGELSSIAIELFTRLAPA